MHNIEYKNKNFASVLLDYNPVRVGDLLTNRTVQNQPAEPIQKNKKFKIDPRQASNPRQTRIRIKLHYHEKESPVSNTVCSDPSFVPDRCISGDVSKGPT